MAVSRWQRNGTGNVWVIDDAGYQSRRLEVVPEERDTWNYFGIPINNMPAHWFDAIPVA